MWRHFGFQLFYTVLVFIQNKTLLKRGREKRSAPIQFQRHFKGNPFFMNIIFYSAVRKLFGKVLVWSAQEGALKNRLWRGLTMPPLCCVSVSPRCSEQRNGKDYPQECLGCPQTERSARPTDQWESAAEWRANFFLMNSAACSITESDCQRWTHIWSMFGELQWQDQFCSGQREKWTLALLLLFSKCWVRILKKNKKK